MCNSAMELPKPVDFDRLTRMARVAVKFPLPVQNTCFLSPLQTPPRDIQRRVGRTSAQFVYFDLVAAGGSVQRCQ